LPVLGPEIPRAGGPVSRALGHAVLAASGWRVTGTIPNIRKFVIIAAPHTSNWDFVVGIAAKLALRLGVTFFGKDSLFRFPLGALMRAWGGMPVDRSTSNDVVSGIVDEFARRDTLVIALAPEGTRKPVERWRTGFYHIAHAARVPIVPVALNFGAKEIQIGEPFDTTGDVEHDVAALRARFAGVRGRRRTFVA
jgi:1-acyl-sn-glycerol-3-phosphate acyltransferase